MKASPGRWRIHLGGNIMTIRHAGRADRGLAALSVLLGVILAGCGGSSGVHTQAPTSDPPMTPTNSSATPQVSKSSSITPSSSASAIPTPKVTGAAQDVVAAYIAFYNLSTAADRDPAHADLAKLDQYLTGKARMLFNGAYRSMKSHGLAYRGTPDVPRLKVGSIRSPSFMFLTNCPAASTSDPFVQYNVSTGEPVASRKPPVPPPWKRTISMKKVGGGWKVTDILVDTSKTCSG
jgi:hypothetical protein